MLRYSGPPIQKESRDNSSEYEFNSFVVEAHDVMLYAVRKRPLFFVSTSKFFVVFTQSLLFLMSSTIGENEDYISPMVYDIKIDTKY